MKKTLFILAGLAIVFTGHVALKEVQNRALAIPDGQVFGRVLLGPVCPVETNPPVPGCELIGYQTIVQAIKIGSPKSSPFAVVKANENGYFSFSLPEGQYGFQPVGGNPLPSCETKDVDLKSGAWEEIELNCDSGIR